MSAQKRLARALALVLPQGALGASLVLALSTTASALPAGSGGPPDAGVAERLKAIRSGVAEMAPGSSGSAEPGAPTDGEAAPTWWGNGGWGRWHLGWGNGGFGWPNWHNWGNGWHNWGNGGWNNWNNGWHNFWHNW